MSSVLSAQPEVIPQRAGAPVDFPGRRMSTAGRKPSVLRACAMTLIIATDTEDTDAFEATQTVISLMQAHPSRAIFLRRSPDRRKRHQRSRSRGGAGCLLAKRSKSVASRWKSTQPGKDGSRSVPRCAESLCPIYR